MTKQSTFKEDLVRFSRIIVMLFNRATIYHMGHPYVIQSLDDFHPAIQQVFNSVSPLVCILHRDQFFIDEEPVDSRINVQRIAAHFKKAGIQSISFEKDLGRNEMKAFVEIFTSLDAYPDAEAMKKAMVTKGIRNMKLNHVFFRKVSQDDEVISHDALKKLTADMSVEEQRKSKKVFVDLVLENLLSEELRETLTVENLLKNPGGLSRKMAETDRRNAGPVESEGKRQGLVLLHQLEILGDEVEKNLESDEDADLPKLAAALFEMKKRLFEGLEAQKSLDISYSNEEVILDKANEITDGVVLRIIKDEYKGGKTPVGRLAQILRRLVPEPTELKRLLPGIRVALMEEGMSLTEYLHLVQELSKELQSDELARILQQSSEAIGIDGQTLIEEVKRSPGQAAELIFLASEIRKGSGDEHVLTDLLVDYVERLGSNLASETPKDNQEEAEQHFRRIITTIESRVVGRLKKMDVKDDLLERLEQRFNKRLDEIIEKVKLDWIHSHTPRDRVEARPEMSVLDLLEQSVGEGDELGEILAFVRSRVLANEMNENDFGQIYAAINEQQQKRALEIERKMPRGVLPSATLTLIIEKEIARAKRYGTPFSALCFSLIRAVQKSAGPALGFSHAACMTAVLKAMSIAVRGADVMGQLGNNIILVLLPMTAGNQAQLALKRCVKVLHARPVNVEGTMFNVRVAGVAATYDAAYTADAGTFIQAVMKDLTQMERRIKNLQAYF